MSSADKNLSVFNTNDLPDISDKKFGILVAEWNSEVTEKLFEGAYNTLLQHGAREKNIERGNVPGSFELTLGSQWFAGREDIDAVIALGVVIQGETKHNDYINHAVAHGLTNVGIKTGKPVIFGVLTPNNMEQALDRAGGVHGNKGDEAAMTAIKMLGLKKNISGGFFF
ncbi:6,7-dimethyl-8-ribityllumazine synthase [Dyadobacter sandarakinus]|uniref:6,7-dimethyl-8-ribityllumazine synthase n=1 Tax=Dyadobacter sandarakinus TaxID=2747268 RepID=A0ABX7IBK1_9BACT|nr:6,7-dimethyl-8-ribityllumazine synthase [Dyadobacter sandarakinus]QRR02832.1 6,7-dimethyl-8-ribityllumazine synthase [Dyadobacter sandarakinus]